MGRGRSRLTPALESTLGCLFPAPHSMTSCWELASGLGEGTAQKCTHGKSGLDFSLQSPLLNIHQRCAAWKPQSVPSTGSHRSPPPPGFKGRKHRPCLSLRNASKSHQKRCMWDGKSLRWPFWETQSETCSPSGEWANNTPPWIVKRIKCINICKA